MNKNKVIGIGVSFRYIGYITLFMIFFASNSVNAKNCNAKITGVITDKNHQPLVGVGIKATNNKGLRKVFITKTSGKFAISNLCAGKYQLEFVEMGFKTVRKQVTLKAGQSLVLNIVLTPQVQQLGTVKIEGKLPSTIATATESEIDGNALMKAGGDNLGQILKKLPGVTALHSGPTISKPAIHGLTGNRVLIMNNGVRQEGQQWGNDHGAEVDPFTAGKITVVKGAASIRYGTDAIAGVVRVQPPKISETPGISGHVNLIGASNGRKGGLSADLQGAFGKKLKGLTYRLQGTLQQSGNKRTPHYYLANTGMAEGDFTAFLGYRWKKMKLSASYSQYNAKIGIFSGSEIGDTSDLIAAFNHRDNPLTPNTFTYNIHKGYQQVNHDILKLEGQYHFSNKGKLTLTYAHQKDIRKEYSAEVIYSKDHSLQNLPEDYFKLLTNTVDLIYKMPYRNGFHGSIGFSGMTKGNVFQGLGRWPLIPNYRDYSGGLFAIEHYHIGDHWLVEAGLRYDYLWRRYYRYNINTLDEFETSYSYHNLSGTAGASYKLNHQLTVKANFGIGWRPPSPNEMYILGVHASAAQFAIGDSTLNTERSYNTSLSLNYHKQKWQLSVDLYDNEINNFIYMEPIGTRQIVGVGYHAYRYVQDNVRMLGADISLDWNMIKNLSFHSKTSLLRATNKSLHGGLINMPPSRFQNGLTLHGLGWGVLTNPYFTLKNVSVLKQDYIVPEQREKLPLPPPAYSLWNISMGAVFPIGTNKLDLNLAVDNLTNKVYSDYMNLFRFFAYDPGINVKLRVKFSF